VENLRVSRRVARLATGPNAAGGFFRASSPHNVTEPKMDSRWGLGAQMPGATIKAFLTELAVEGNVTAGTQNQAKCALLFLF
jgi:hypothetical protein